MQKKLIALAVAGLASSAAFAQSNVTVYGVVDVTFESVEAKGATTAAAVTAAPADKTSRNRVTSNSSYLGFKGEEALGNGLKAKFLFEAGFSPDSAGGALTGTTRDGWVALGGNFGDVRLGQYNTAIRSIGTVVDYNPGYTGIGAISNVIGNVAGVKTGSDDRISNAIGYFSPNWSGFQLSAIYGANENKAGASADGTTLAGRNNGRYDFGATYTNGGLYVGAAYGESKDQLGVVGGLPGTLPANANSKLKNARIGAKYSFGSGTSISALWDSQKLEASTLAGVRTSFDRDAWEIGAKQDFGAHSIYGTYAAADDVSNVNNSGVKGYTLGYLYNFSKRTQLKAYYTEVKNDSGAQADFYNGGITPAVGADPKGYGVGVRHSF